MKRTILFLMALVLMALSLPAYAADFTAQEISDATLKARFEVPQTEKWMRVWMPSLFTKMNAITSTTTGAVTYPVLATTTTNSGAKLVGVLDTANYFTGTVVETILAELGLSRSKLALTTSGNGASLIGVYDNAGYFAGTDVEAVLANVGAALLALNTKIVNVVDIVSATAPADPNVNGYRVFMTATNGGLNQGYIYVWDDAENTWDAGTLLANGSMVASKGNPPDVVIGGTAAANFVRLSGKMNLVVPGAAGRIATLGTDGQITDSGDLLSEYAQLAASPVNDEILLSDTFGQPKVSGYKIADIGGLVLDAALAGDAFVADPAVTGYKVLATTTAGGHDKGKVYTWNDTTNLYDAGVLLANGHFAGVKGGGSAGDFAIGGVAGTDVFLFSDLASLFGPRPTCKTITVALGADTGVTGADAAWVGATVHSVVPVSANDQPVESIAVAGDGVVTLTTAAVETAEAVFRVCSWL